MRVLVTGGRNYADSTRVWEALACLRPSVVIHGDARGADTHAAHWCLREASLDHGVEAEVYRPNWVLGPSAGPLRNQRMLDEGNPDLVLAFPGGRGTRDMVERARKADVPVLLSADWVFQGEGS